MLVCNKKHTYVKILYLFLGTTLKFTGSKNKIDIVNCFAIENNESIVLISLNKISINVARTLT